MRSYIRSGSMMGGSGGDGCCCVDNSIDRNSALFFTNLANKLLQMSKTIEEKIEEIKRDCNKPAPGGRGFIFASIDTPVMSIAVSQEYIEYIKRYGPPPNGKFVPLKLHLLRIELGIPSMYTEPDHGVDVQPPPA
jgi:hypothetical protein